MNFGAKPFAERLEEKTALLPAYYKSSLMDIILLLPNQEYCIELLTLNFIKRKYGQWGASLFQQHTEAKRREE